MRVSAVLTAAGLLGVLVGAALISRFTLGLALIADSAAVVFLGMWRDVPEKPTGLRRRNQ